MAIYDKSLSDSSLVEATLRTLRDPLIQNRYKLNPSEVSRITDGDGLRDFLVRQASINPGFFKKVDPDNPVTPVPRKGLEPFIHEQWKREWGDLFQKKRDTLIEFSQSVGCIKLDRNSLIPDASKPIGTGWLIHDNLVATNWHVVEKFFMLNNGEVKFKPSGFGNVIRLSINFSNDWRSSSLEFGVTEALFLAQESDAEVEKGDLALLKLEVISTLGEPLPLPLSVNRVSPNVQEKVCVIGYPNKENDKEWDEIKEFVVPVDEDKYLGFGNVASAIDEKGNFQHKCNTTPGNSGSPIISLETDNVVGIHFKWKEIENEEFNLGISVIQLFPILANLGYKEFA